MMVNFSILFNRFPRVFENYWNNKWKQSVVMYKADSTQDFIDIRKVFGKSNDDMIRLASQIKKEYPNIQDRAKAIHSYAVTNFKYVSDSIKHGKPEYWQSSWFTHQEKTGDCEDGSIWILDMLALAGIPAWRRKLCAGWVQSSPTAPQGGHAYVIFLADDLKWYVLDWCYYPTFCRRAWLKRPQNMLPYYKSIWWTTNEKLSWAQHSTRINAL